MSGLPDYQYAMHGPFATFYITLLVARTVWRHEWHITVLLSFGAAGKAIGVALLAAADSVLAQTGAAGAVRVKKLLSAERAPGALSPSSSGGQLRPSAAHAARMSTGSGAWILSGSPVAGCLTYGVCRRCLSARHRSGRLACAVFDDSCQ